MLLKAVWPDQVSSRKGYQQQNISGGYVCKHGSLSEEEPESRCGSGGALWFLGWAWRLLLWKQKTEQFNVDGLDKEHSFANRPSIGNRKLMEKGIMVIDKLLDCQVSSGSAHQQNCINMKNTPINWNKIDIITQYGFTDRHFEETLVLVLKKLSHEISS